MRILLGRHSGFCFGVKRAVETAEALADTAVTVYTYGAIIHNDAVVERLKNRNVIPVEDIRALSAGDRLIVRAHGAPPQLYRDCEARGIRLIDATCPFVKRIHRIAQAAAARGRTVVIAGKYDHPEVIGIRGWAVTTSSELPAAVAEFLAHDGPAVLDVTVARQALSIPPAITAAQAKGFTLWSLRTVLSGRGDELIDLAEVNLLSRLRRPKE